MIRFLGASISLAAIVTLMYLYWPSAHRKISDSVVQMACRPGSEKTCHDLGKKLIYSPRTIYTGAVALNMNCNRGVVASCEPAAQAWEALARPDLSRLAYERGCGLGDGDSCFSYYMFLTRHAEYVPDARPAMESACNYGQGDHSACVFMTIVYEEEGRVLDALRVMKTMCDQRPAATECWSAGELLRQKGDFTASAKYFLQACKLGESRGCDSYTQVAALGDPRQSRLPTWVAQALQDVRRFGQLMKQEPNQRALKQYEQYLARWKYYRQHSAAIPSGTQELSRAKILFQQTLQDVDLVTQLMIRGARGGGAKANKNHIRNVAAEALSKTNEVEKVIKRYPTAQ